MKSILSYPDRGKWGNAKYRGNTSGHVIKDLLEHFKPQKFVEVFSGGGTGKDVALDLGITNSVHLDLNTGWDALIDDIPTGSDFVFSHPPYWDIISYSGSMYPGEHHHDLSKNMNYEEFISKLDQVNSKIFTSLLNGGRHAFLVGDVRKKGKYYSIIKDMTWIGDCEAHLIKTQFNCVSDRKIYGNNSFIPINHEHLLVFRKNKIWEVSIKFTRTGDFNLKDFAKITWRDLIQNALESLNGQATLKEIYRVIEGCRKAQNNPHWKEKVRQTLQLHDNFSPVERGLWRLNIA